MQFQNFGTMPEPFRTFSEIFRMSKPLSIRNNYELRKLPRFETIVPRNHYEHRNFFTNGGPYALRFSAGNGQKCPSNFEKPQVPLE